MTVGILKLKLFIHESNSLKDKRMVLHSLKQKLRNNFNVSVSQMDDGDKWQRAVICVATLNKDKRSANALLCGVVNFVERFNNLNLIDHEMELI